MRLLFPIMCITYVVHSVGSIFQRTENNIGWDKFLADEPTEFHDLPLTWERNASLPTWLRGSYVKNGPSQKRFGTENRWYTQYMDSWGKLNKFTFKGDGSSVLYSGRMIETKNYLLCKEAEKLVPTITVAGVSPNDWSMEEIMEGVINNYDNTNVILWRLGPEDKDKAQYIATTDYPLVNIIDPDTLAVTGQKRPSILDGISMSSSSHWRRELGTDNSLNFHLMLNTTTLKPDLALYRYGDNVIFRELIGRFNIEYVSYIHMISVTPKYAVIVVYPVILNFGTYLEHNMHPLETLEQLDEPTKIFLMDLSDGSVMGGFESWDPSLVFATHHMNSWEEGEDEVVVDLATNPWDAMLKYADIETILHHEETDKETADQVMKRVRLNLKSRTMEVEDWPNDSGIPMMNTMDFPIINENYLGYKNRYVYGWVGIDYWRMTLIKKDLEDSSDAKTWSKASHYPGEMFFIPNPEGTEEDDGVLVTVVLDGTREESYLLVLDAQTFEEINHAYLPYIIPFSFHGNWFPELY